MGEGATESRLLILQKYIHVGLPEAGRFQIICRYISTSWLQKVSGILLPCPLPHLRSGYQLHTRPARLLRQFDTAWSIHGSREPDFDSLQSPSFLSAHQQGSWFNKVPWTKSPSCRLMEEQTERCLSKSSATKSPSTGIIFRQLLDQCQR